MFAALDNTVTLPGYINVDAALYISPGSPRAIRVALVEKF
jgi:hypothetical protein